MRLEVIDPGLSSPTHAFVSGLSGQQLTTTSLGPAPGGGRTVGVRLDDWLMVPDTRTEGAVVCGFALDAW